MVHILTFYSIKIDKNHWKKFKNIVRIVEYLFKKNQKILVKIENKNIKVEKIVQNITKFVLKCHKMRK